MSSSPVRPKASTEAGPRKPASRPGNRNTLDPTMALTPRQVMSMRPSCRCFRVSGRVRRLFLFERRREDLEEAPRRPVAQHGPGDDQEEPALLVHLTPPSAWPRRGG